MDRKRTDANERRAARPPRNVRGAARAQQVLQRAMATELEILAAAEAAMAEQGYHATSVREIADRAGMSVANVYHYFESKHAILFRLMDENAQVLIDSLEEAVAGADTDPRSQLVEATRAFAALHTSRSDLAFVTSTELRALDPEARATVVEKRRRIEEIFVDIVQAGTTSGDFAVDDVSLSTRQLLDMTRSLSSWYRTDGRLSEQEIGDAYSRAALVLMGTPERRPPPKPARRAKS